jgi:cysteine desulfurase/selenocysteine lyase
MIETVRFEQTTYASSPNKFEAGTPPIAGAIGLGAAIDYVAALDLNAVAEHERQLLAYATEQLAGVPGLRLIGTAPRKASVLSFVMERPAISAYELGIALDMMGIAIRTGHHCCMPVMDRLGINGTARASLAMYNTPDDVDALVAGLHKLAGGIKARPAPAPVVDEQHLRFPEPAAPSPQAAADELIEAFELLGDWEARDQYLLELGEKLPPMPDSLKTEANRVHGCMSTVHLHARKRPGPGDAIDFLADSDAHLVRGLIAILQRLFSGQSAAAILAFDTEKFLSQLGLDRHLSMGRRTGLAGMIRRIGQEAARLGKAT